MGTAGRWGACRGEVLVGVARGGVLRLGLQSPTTTKEVRSRRLSTGFDTDFSILFVARWKERNHIGIRVEIGNRAFLLLQKQRVLPRNPVQTLVSNLVAPRSHFERERMKGSTNLRVERTHRVHVHARRKSTSMLGAPGASATRLGWGRAGTRGRRGSVDGPGWRSPRKRTRLRDAVRRVILCLSIPGTEPGGNPEYLEPLRGGCFNHGRELFRG